MGGWKDRWMSGIDRSMNGPIDGWTNDMDRWTVRQIDESP